MSDVKTDLLDNSLSFTEEAVLDIHERLEKLLAREDLPPCIEANARQARATTWQMMVDLDLAYSPLGE